MNAQQQRAQERVQRATEIHADAQRALDRATIALVDARSAERRLSESACVGIADDKTAPAVTLSYVPVTRDELNHACQTGIAGTFAALVDLGILPFGVAAENYVELSRDWLPAAVAEIHADITAAMAGDQR